MSQYTDTDEKPEPTRPDIKAPDDFEDEIAFLAHMRKEFEADSQADKLNADAALEDLKFFVSDQWDEGVRSRREDARKPVLTIDRLNAFVAQIVGNRRLNETTIKILPDNGGTEATARVREGLVRSIQKISRADIAYDTTMLNTAVCGIGNFQCYLDYESDDVFEQKICISAIPNALAVVWDRMLTDPTGSDAGHVFVVDSLPREYFKTKYPWAQPSDMGFIATSAAYPMTGDWVTQDNVRVVSYWRMRTRKRTLALMQTGATVDITDDKTPETTAAIVTRADGTPIMREVDRKYAEMYLCSGTDILEGPYELQISRVPVFRVPAWEAWVGETKHRWGLVRKMKDAQRQHNYARSVLFEKMMQSPRAAWLASDDSVAGYEKDYRNSNISDDPLLRYAAGTMKPERMSPAQIEAGWLEISELTTQDLKDVSNIHEANLGMPSNEVSGAAIQARQRVSDTGTVIYHDNLNAAIEQCGMVINDLIPTVYDTPRIIRVLGEDARQDLQAINDIGNPKSVDITSGKYAVSVSTGPSYQTKRVEATQSILAFVNAAPQTAAYVIDVLADAMDWPKHEEIARRLRMLLPPEMLDPRDMTPALQQRAQAMAEQGQKQAQMQEVAASAALQKTMSETALNSARAKNFEEEAGAQDQRIQNESMDTASRAQDRELRGRLEAVKIASGAS